MRISHGFSRPIRPWIRQSVIVVAVASIVGMALTGCVGSGDENRLSTPHPHGKVSLFSDMSGNGSKDLGAFEASGTISISGSCTGKGKATITIPPTGEKFGIVCQSRSGRWAGLGTVDFAAGSVRHFSVKVTAATSTHWVIGGAASGK